MLSAAPRASLKARLHRRFLSRQLDAIFVALKLQLQNRTCKHGAIFSAICRRDIAGVSNMFKTDATLLRQKLHRVAATKIACVNGPLRFLPALPTIRVHPDLNGRSPDIVHSLKMMSLAPFSIKKSHWAN